ncbi:hypothetical protein K1T71_011775 [Dendrolimus kikuchii]|uniref:Uncharacterized protein n=1 Tax=Dendrolimus kikuchii TaxID=765133 RepID=A0ACC1CM36_9NEOP|nr:hypothetical protein K1T71_011775 [Dendrolimus kikuchii]
MFLRILFLYILLKSSVIAERTNVTISLNKTITKINKELYGDFFYLNNKSILYVNFENVNPKVSFIIFQVHSHMYNVSVFNNSLFSETPLQGTNVGFYAPVKKLDAYFIVNENDVELKVYISVHGYSNSDPIPGGCCLESHFQTCPSMMIQERNMYRYIDVAPSQRENDTSCVQTDNVEIIFRIKYLPERNYDADSYFDAIRTMMTPRGFKNEKKIPNSVLANRCMLSAYPGTGAIYVAIANDVYTGAYSVYVPTYSYGCSPLNNDCDLLDDVLSEFTCAILLFIGVFLCYFGHRFFKTEMFLMGLMVGATLTYIFITSTTDIDQSALLAASVISGIFFGAIWLMLWWFYAIPLISVLLPSINLGILCAAVLNYAAIDNFPTLMIEVNFWLAFLFVVLATAGLLLSVTFYANILCCAILGSYAAIYPIDYYLGSNLKYIMINILRRATVKLFRKANLLPIFQWRDALALTLWILLFTTGVAYQYYTSLGKPPFPPPPRSTRPEPPGYGTISRRNERNGALSQNINREASRNNERTSLLG